MKFAMKNILFQSHILDIYNEDIVDNLTVNW